MIELPHERPLLALAPMQDVTDWAFWKLIAGYGGADIYFTEYFRVTPGYRLHKSILRSITENPTGRPAIAQIIGNDLEWMVRCARDLEEFSVAGVDLNLGCPAPVVYRKCAGGGLLRDPERVHTLLGSLREGIRGTFTVKTRIGFSEAAEFDALLEIFAAHRLDLLTVHARTVLGKYGPEVHEDRIAQAVRRLDCPVIANGSIGCVADARRVWQKTGAAGLMIGRAAIRNPWIFQQIRDDFAGKPVWHPTGRDVLAYVEDLYAATCTEDVPEKCQVQRMKKFMNFIGDGLEGAFLHDIRRVTTKCDFFQTCRKAFDHGEEVPEICTPGSGSLVRKSSE